MTRILVPLDGSALSEMALPHALARLFPGDELLLVRVAAPAFRLQEMLVEVKLPDLERLESERYLEAQALKLGPQPFVVRSRVLGGGAWEAILVAAVQEQVDMILMASHGRNGVERWLIGSVAENVARRAPCPVLLVRCRNPQRAQPGVMASTILVPLDGSSLAERALTFLRNWPEARGARVLLMCASQLVPSLGWLDEIPERRRKILEELRGILADHGRQLQAEGYNADWLVYDGEDPSAAILEVAQAAHADLVVMTTHGRTGLGRWLLGSVAERVLRLGDCPLVLVNARDAEQPVA